MPQDFSRASLRTLSGALALGTVRSRDLLDRSLSAHGPSLEAYKLWLPDLAKSQAEAADAARHAGITLGPLQGIPMSIKDLYGLEGQPIFAGSPTELPVSWRREGPLVRRLRGQLGVTVGKTHTVEFAFGGLGANSHWPVPRNPRDRQHHRAPGGSSSGAGVSLVEGTALLALGTDTGGSVRIPASFTGTVALKTTWGRWSTEGIVPLSPSLDTAGFLVRSAEDAAFAFTALDGEAVPELDSLTGLRVALAEPFFFDRTSPGISEAVEAAARCLEASGARLSRLGLPGCDELFEHYRRGGIVAPELYRFLQSELPAWLPTLDRRVRRRVEAGMSLPAWDYLDRKARFVSLGKAAGEALSAVDVLVSPTVPITPPTMAEIADDDRYSDLNALALRNTCVISFLGLCAVTLPVGLDAAGMPVGLQMIGRPHTEARLLSLARLFEAAFRRSGLWEPLAEPDISRS